MKNIEKIGVVELTENEIRTLNGGGWLAYALGYMLGCHNSAEGRAVANAMHDLPK